MLYGSMGFDKCILLRIYYHSVRQNIFTALKILYVLPIQPSPCQTLFKILLYPCSSSYSTIS